MKPDIFPLKVIEGGRNALEADALRSIWLGTQEESRAAIRRLAKPANSSLHLITCNEKGI
jgi:hypothetical protein